MSESSPTPDRQLPRADRFRVRLARFVLPSGYRVVRWRVMEERPGLALSEDEWESAEAACEGDDVTPTTEFQI